MLQAIIDGNDMIEILQLENMEPRKMFCERFNLAANSLALLCGTGESGKSMFGMWLACHVSAGLPLFDKFPITQGKTIHIDQEQSKDQTLIRYSRLSKGLGIDKLNIQRIHFSRKLDDGNMSPSEVESMLVDLATGSSLMFIDSLKAISSVDENSSEIEKVVKMLKRVAERAECCVLLIHHKGKGKDAKQSGRGHSSIYDSVDVQIDMDEKDREILVSCKKSRDDTRFEGLSYSIIDTGEYIVKHKKYDQLKLMLLEDNINPIKDDRDKILEILATKNGINQGELYDLIKGDSKKFKIELSSLEKDKLIDFQIGPRGAHLYSLTKEGKNYLSYLEEK